MKVLFINSVCGIGSTGRICAELAEQFADEGHECKIAYGRDSFVPEKYRKYAVRIGSDLAVKAHALRSRILDDHGWGSVAATRKFLKWMEEFQPDLLWLHNIHGYYINYRMLFDWIKKHPDLQVKWTLHDCWAFTGHCAHFSMVKCNRWKDHCHDCPQKHSYPASVLRENSFSNFEVKRASFTGVSNMTLITPSVWLANLVKQSFLGEYPVEVCYNKIDKNVFKPTSGTFRKGYGLENKKIVLGVSSVWNEQKGLNDFFRLSGMLDERFVIVLVGLNKKQIANLPENIIGITRTNNMTELAEIYTAADIFVNFSQEETFGMTTVEAMYCGTQAVVYKGTACEEIVEKFGGMAVEANVESVYAVIKDI